MEMAGWENRRAWLRALAHSVPEELDTPLAVAKYETAAYFSDGRQAEIRLDRELKDGYEISKTENGFLVRGGETGALYGAYALIRACEAGEEIPAGVQKPCYDLRMVNCWDNMDGSVERGYAGRSMCGSRATGSITSPRAFVN